MRATRLPWVIAASLAAAAAARACFPGAPWQLLDDRHATLREAPVNSFAWEAARLAKPSSWYHPPAASSEAASLSDADGRAQAEGEGLSPPQRAALAAMRAAPDSRWALSQAGTLPQAVRLYTGGAVAFAHGNMADAREYFRFVLDLPPPQAAPRAVWAQFMLGRIAARADAFGEAEAAFSRVRERVAGGAPDPLGLAVASLGEQARLRLGQADVAGAVALYAEQAADGSEGAVQSLRIVAEQAMAHPDRLPALVAVPLVQRLLVIHALGVTGDALHAMWTGTGGAVDGFWPPDTLDTGSLKTLLAAVLAQPGAVAEADRLAALAYRLDDTDAASALAGRSVTPLALWIRAKLALKTGGNAAPAFSAALEAARKPDQTALEASSVGLLRGETATALLDGGDFVQAATVLWPVAATYWGDFAYLAERVLTADELRGFVDGTVPSVPEGGAGETARNLRNLLARRLVREGRIGDALAYFTPAASNDLAQPPYDPRPDARALEAAQARARSALFPITRAEAGWDAARLLRHHGMELMGTEGHPDQAFVNGEFSEWLFPGAEGPFQKANSGATAAERGRYEASRPRPDQRFHYRYLAIEDALDAARDLPARSQAFAAVLCQAAGWRLGAGDVAGAFHLYKQYARVGAHVSFARHFGHGCPAPDFSAAWRAPARVVLLEAHAAVHRHRTVSAASASLAAILTLAAAAMRLRTVRRRAPEA